MDINNKSKVKEKAKKKIENYDREKSAVKFEGKLIIVDQTNMTFYQTVENSVTSDKNVMI